MTKKIETATIEEFDAWNDEAEAITASASNPGALYYWEES